MAEAVSACEIVLTGAATGTGAGVEATTGAGAATVVVVVAVAFFAVRLAGAAAEDISFMLMVEEVLQEYKRGNAFLLLVFACVNFGHRGHRKRHLFPPAFVYLNGFSTGNCA